MYAKKVLIFNQISSGFSVKGRQLCGMVKLITNGKQNTEATVFVTNADIRQFGEWWVVLYVGQNIYVQNLDTLNCCTFSIAETHLDSLAALLIKRDNGVCRLVAQSSLNKTIDFAMRENVKQIIDVAENNGRLNKVYKYTPPTTPPPQKTEKPAPSTQIFHQIQQNTAYPSTSTPQIDTTATVAQQIQQISAETAILPSQFQEIQQIPAQIDNSDQNLTPQQQFAQHFASQQQFEEHSAPHQQFADNSAPHEPPSHQVDSTVYEKFVAGTQNYYAEHAALPDVEKLRSSALGKLKSVEDYSTAFEKYYAAGRGDNYYDSVKKEIAQLFLQFPPYFPLIEKYRDSFFVRVDFPTSGRYFVMGVVEKDSKVKYICYGVPGSREGFSDKDFTYVENNPDGFWMLFQDAETGQLTVGE